jgi:hypothetical protein
MFLPVIGKSWASLGKLHPITGHEGPEGEQRYSSTLSLTLVLDGVGGQHHAPLLYPWERDLVPLHRRLGGSQGRYAWLRKIFLHRDSTSRPSSL